MPQMYGYPVQPQLQAQPHLGPAYGSSNSDGGRSGGGGSGPGSIQVQRSTNPQPGSTAAAANVGLPLQVTSLSSSMPNPAMTTWPANVAAGPGAATYRGEIGNEDGTGGGGGGEGRGRRRSGRLAISDLVD